MKKLFLILAVVLCGCKGGAVDGVKVSLIEKLEQKCSGEVTGEMFMQSHWCNSTFGGCEHFPEDYPIEWEKIYGDKIGYGDLILVKMEIDGECKQALVEPSRILDYNRYPDPKQGWEIEQREKIITRMRGAK